MAGHLHPRPWVCVRGWRVLAGLREEEPFGPSEPTWTLDSPMAGRWAPPCLGASPPPPRRTHLPNVVTAQGYLPSRARPSGAAANPGPGGGSVGGPGCARAPSRGAGQGLDRPGVRIPEAVPCLFRFPRLRLAAPLGRTELGAPRPHAAGSLRPVIHSASKRGGWNLPSASSSLWGDGGGGKPLLSGGVTPHQ